MSRPLSPQARAAGLYLLDRIADANEAARVVAVASDKGAACDALMTSIDRLREAAETLCREARR
jgi:hypothetical protein